MKFTEHELKLIEDALEHYDAYLISQKRESEEVQALCSGGSAEAGNKDYSKMSLPLSFVMDCGTMLWSGGFL